MPGLNARLVWLTAGTYPTCHLALAARSDSGKHDLSILKTSLGDQVVKHCSVLRRNAYATMRHRFAESLHLVAAMNGVTIFHEEDGMRHRGVVPLLAVPDFVHGSCGKGS